MKNNRTSTSKVTLLTLVCLNMLFLFQCACAQSADSLVWHSYRDKEGNWSLRSLTGKQLNNAIFDSIVEVQSTPIFAIMLKGKWGVINPDGKYIVPVLYSSLGFLPEKEIGMIHVTKKEADGRSLQGIYNFNGELISPFKYCICFQDIGSGSNGPNPTLTYSHISGSRIYRCYYDRAQKKMEIVSLSGKVLIDTLMIEQSKEKPVAYLLNNNSVIATRHLSSMNLPLLKSYNELIKTTFPDSSVLGESKLYVVETDAGQALIRAKGDIIVPAGKYEYGKGEDNVINVTKNGKWGLIDHKGRVVVKLKYDDSLNMQKGFKTITVSSGKALLLDSSFKQEVIGDYQGLRRLSLGVTGYSKDVFLTYKNNKFGLVQEKKELLPAVYEEGSIQLLGSSENMLILVQEKSTHSFTLMNTDGKILQHEKNAEISHLFSINYLIKTPDKFSVFNIATCGFICSYEIPPVPIGYSVPPILIQSFSSLDQSAKIIGVYRYDKGWEILDESGKVIMHANHKECSFLRPIFRGSSFWGCIYSSKEGSAVETPSGVIIPFIKHRMEYAPVENRIHEFVADSVRIRSMDGKILKTLLAMNLMMLTHTALDSVYFYSEGNLRNICDFNFKPLLPESFNAIIIKGKNNYIGQRNGKSYLLLSGKTVSVSRAYDMILDLGGMYAGNHGKLTDLYTKKGELLFKDCEKWNLNISYSNFIQAGKKYWVNKTGHIYMSEKL